ncbi:MAG: nucleoside triphosphate pyrophosphohydrolase family protein [Candidatus Pacebacteria bacterium]|nr:nucleoside triphosphate pyrophosphohydrolase family protein [Candidatus Paceibacterota bacterium]
MDFNEYQKKTYETLIHKDRDNLAYFALGVAGESGEVADKIKKIFRDKDGIMSDEDKKEVAKEMGDVLWYLSQLAQYIGKDFAEIAQMNLDKLKDRQERGTLSGSGDNR